MIPISGSKGLTLIEVVVASLLLVSALAPIFTLIHSCLDNFNSAGNRSQLVAAGKAVMEETVSSMDYSIKEQNGLIYSGEANIRYDLSISNYQNSYHIRSIEIRIYEEDKAEKAILLYILRELR